MVVESMNYKIVSLDGGNQFDLNGVRFNGNSYLFWKKKNTKVVREVVVVFDKKYENMQVSDGIVILSLKGLNQYSTIKEALQTFRQIFGNMDMKFHFLVANENEKLMVDKLASELGISYMVQNMNKNIKTQQEKNVRAMEEEMKHQNLSASGDQMISKYDNGTLKQITVHNGVAYENQGLLNSEEEKTRLLREWMNDPVKAEELRKLSVEARNDLLMKTIMSNRRAYQMESASQVNAYDKVGDVAKDKAFQEDGMVNSELGIVKNHVSSTNSYSSVEKVGDNGVQVVNSNVMKANISVGGLSGSSFEQRNQVSLENQTNVGLEQEQERNIEKVFYIDDDYNLYDDTGKLIGKIGVDGYMPDYSNNTLKKNGQVIGYIGDYRQMNNNNEYSKPKTRIYKKEKVYESEKSSAFVSLPVIIFVLSALLLIASIVLLFVVE